MYLGTGGNSCLLPHRREVQLVYELADDVFARVEEISLCKDIRML
jgi:hypothetical protein